MPPPYIFLLADTYMFFRIPTILIPGGMHMKYRFFVLLLAAALLLSGCVSTGERLEQVGARAEKLQTP